MQLIARLNSPITISSCLSAVNINSVAPIFATQEEHFLSLLVALSMVLMSDRISVLLRTHSIQGQSVLYTTCKSLCPHSF